jgi:uncharacterized membrane protein YdbT with pleckstrin-like domain
MSEVSHQRSGGIGFAGLLTLIFITLKLTHYIEWSWWWVLSPVWITAALAILIILVVLCVPVVITLIGAIVLYFTEKRARRLHDE